MSEFRKKPVVVEARQWFKNGDHPMDNCFRPFEDTGKIPEEPREGEIVRYYRTPDLDGQKTCVHCGNIMHVHGWIDTLEGGHIVCPGDWVITGVKGEHYPCKPDIFAATYDPVDAAPAACEKHCLSVYLGKSFLGALYGFNKAMWRQRKEG